MPRKHLRRPKALSEQYPPSEPCSCAVCTAYCARPGWWSVEEAARAIQDGYASRMMLELAPDRLFGVLAPAFRGCEGTYATQESSSKGCNFFNNGLCDLHGTGHMPLECRFCHHDRLGQGVICHAALEADWAKPAGQELVAKWQRLTGFWKRKVNLLVQP